MGKVSIQDVSKILLDKYGLAPAEAENFVSSIFDVIRNGLESDRLVKIKGLGTFKIIGVEARESVNVNTGERVLIDSHGKITFTPDTTMKELVNKPFSQFDTVILGEEIELEPAKPEDEESEQDRADEELAEEQTVDNTYNVREERLAAALEEAVDLLAEPATPDAAPDDVKSTSVAEDAPEVVTVASEVVSETLDTSAVAPENTAEPEEPADEVTSEEKDEANVDAQPDNQEVTDKDAEPEETEEDLESEGGSHWVRNLSLTVITIALICAAAYGGYRYGRYEAGMEIMSRLTKKAPKPRVAVRPVKTPDTTAVKPIKDTVAAVKRDTVVAVPVEQPKAAAEDYSKYEDMDNRVRTGAYRIVGTDHVRTVKAGETVIGIARRTLGDGMACYIEVYNGIRPDGRLVEGQKLKIPKLELKKKKRK